MKQAVVLGVALLSLYARSAGGCARAAEELRLKEGLSFQQDLDRGFPILGEEMEDASLEPGRPSLIFFAAAGDLNSSRQALRVVELYRRFRSSPLKFIIIDVDRLESASQRRLVKDYYRGYIPQLVMLTGDGKVSWSHVGEVEVSELKQRLKKVL